MFNTAKPTKYVAAGAAAVVLAFGAYSLGKSNPDGNSTGTANAAQLGTVPGSGANGQGPQAGQAAPGRQAPPGLGTPVTGSAASKVKSAVLARYDGTIERIMKLDDGSYVAHVITSNGELHVSVTKGFKVTGAQQGGPPQGGQGAPSGSSGDGTVN